MLRSIATTCSLEKTITHSSSKPCQDREVSEMGSHVGQMTAHLTQNKLPVGSIDAFFQFTRLRV